MGRCDIGRHSGAGRRIYTIYTAVSSLLVDVSVDVSIDVSVNVVDVSVVFSFVFSVVFDSSERCQGLGPGAVEDLAPRRGGGGEVGVRAAVLVGGGARQ